MPGRKKSTPRRSVGRPRTSSPPVPGQLAQGKSSTIRSYAVGALPIIHHLLERMRLESILSGYLGPDDGRVKLPTCRAVLVLVQNVLLARQPIYGVGEWAEQYAPDLLNLWPHELAYLHDDRLGRCLDRLFDALRPELILAVVRHVVEEFQVTLDELHNDSTTVSFYGAYLDAQREKTRRGRLTHAITWGHSKDHRPDLKQLLYTLTVSDDGGVAVYFTSASGNRVDDQTHCQTWDLLRELVGRPDFLYVADCKLASSENLNYIAQQGGRFVTILPGTRKEDAQFRQRLREQPRGVSWELLSVLTDDEGLVVDKRSVCRDEMVSSEGYRVLWYHSTRKVERDQAARAGRTNRALGRLAELRERLQGPKTRFHQRAQVEQAVAEILEEFQVQDWVRVEIEESEQARYRQAHPGRPNSRTQYVKQVATRYSLSWAPDAEKLEEAAADDGVFPLITNERHFTAEQLLNAYKRQPLIEKRFSQFKTDYRVAPVYLKEVSRIQALLGVYFFVLLVQTLLERELRQGMQRKGMDSLPLYPEKRKCTRPTTARVLELFEPVQRYVLRQANGVEETMVTTLSPLQRTLLRLLDISPAAYGQ